MSHAIAVGLLCALTLTASALEVNATNAADNQYQVRVDVPDDHEPAFMRVNIQFPGHLGDYGFAYTSVVYARNGKRVLSFRPQVLELHADSRRELYLLARKDILACMSVVNVYLYPSGNEIHSPGKSVVLNLASFVPDAPQSCKGGVDARNFF